MMKTTGSGLHHIEEKLMHAQGHDNRNRLLIGLAAAAVIVAVVVGVLALMNDDEDPVATDGTTTSEQTTTTTEATTTTEPTTTEPPFQGVNPDLPVFPDPSTSRRFEDPKAAVAAFASEFVGFTHPVVGEFSQADGRSGEVEVRGFDGGAPTTVLLSQLEDDTWFVIGATTDAIRLDTPSTGDTITSPQTLTGMAYAFEGTVNVRLYVDGTQEPIAETFVTGRGDGVLGDFTGELVFTNSSGATHGVLVLTSEGGEDSAPIEAQVIRVLF